MRRPSLRSQLNQIRLWVRQGRTDAWIAHKLDISVEQLEQFKRDHRLDGEAAPAPEPVVVGEDVFEPEDDADEDEDLEIADEDEEEDEEEEVAQDAAAEEEGDSGEPRRRRRGRRGGRRRGGRKQSYEGTFDHGDEGYGLWLDPSVADNDVYIEHWAGHREVTVTLDPDAITIRRSGND